MIFSWLKSRRRKKLLATPLSDEWEGYLRSNLRHDRYLSAAGRARVRDVTRVMVAEKHWTSGGGLELSDEIKVTVSAHAALLTLGQTDPYYFDQVQSIIIHPGAYTHPPEMQNHYLVIHEQMPVFGEAWPRGPIVLSWRHVLDAGRDRSDGANLVLHEFAHHLDGLDGAMEGTPPLADRRQAQNWVRVTEAGYLRLVGNAKRGDVTLLDHYGATNRTEFFAVATESFFERPRALLEQHAELYGVLSDFYRQDPADWLPDATGPPPRGRRDDSDDEDVADLMDPQLLESTDPGELFTWGVTYLDDGRPDLAEQALSRALEIDPHDAEALCLRAKARLRLGEYDGALEDSRAALWCDPEDTSPLLPRGGAYLGLGDFERAVEDLNRVLADEPDDVEGLYLRGLAFNRLGQHRQAIKDLTAAIRRDPYDAEAYFHRSQAYHALGRIKRAKADLEKALQLDPHVQG